MQELLSAPLRSAPLYFQNGEAGNTVSNAQAVLVGIRLTLPYSQNLLNLSNKCFRSVTLSSQVFRYCLFAASLDELFLIGTKA